MEARARMLAMGGVGLIILLLAFPAASSAQVGPGPRPGEQPERVEASDLVRNPGAYSQKTVIVVGDLQSGDMVDLKMEVYRLRGDDVLREIRVAEPGSGSRNLRFLQGQKVEITGIFWDLSQECYSSPQTGAFCYDTRLRQFPAIREGWDREEHRYFIGVIAVDSLEVDVLPEEEEPEEAPDSDIDIPPGELVDLRSLIAEPQLFAGKRVSVIGKFRGNNLYGDLSIRTKKTPRDFVIKVADTAIWVTGRRPRGEGFELNPRMRRDTGKWLKVTGVPWTEGELVYLRAEKLELAPEPEDPGLEPVETVEEPEEEEEHKPRPPEVSFSLPLDGDAGILLDSEFRVQFTNDMDSASFNRNVDLLYVEDDGSDNPFPGMEIRYEAVSRTLVVIPGRRLEPGREIQLILYNGIVDEEGQPLVTSSEAEGIPDAAVVLRFSTADR